MLVIIIIVCNLIIVIFNLYLVWKIYRIKIFLAKTADILGNLPQNLALIGKESSLLSFKTALEIKQINNKYKLLKKRHEQIKQMFV